MLRKSRHEQFIKDTETRSMERLFTNLWLDYGKPEKTVGSTRKSKQGSSSLPFSGSQLAQEIQNFLSNQQIQQEGESLAPLRYRFCTSTEQRSYGRQVNDHLHALLDFWTTALRSKLCQENKNRKNKKQRLKEKGNMKTIL